ncbi:MAG: GatB/YqeY domain-containing protein [Thiohalocapsa sp.]
MLREALSERLKSAMRAKDVRTTSSVRLILAALKERDVSIRSGGNTEGIPDSEILRLLQGMVKQRRESAALYRQGNRPELAAKEEDEIAVIESFMPQQMSEADIAAAAEAAIAEAGAAGIKDMGRVMAVLRERHGGVIDMAKAGAVVKQLLA